MEKLKKIDVPFTQVANIVINNKKISLKAKGLFTYIYSKPKGWKFSIDRITYDNVDEFDSINAGVKELEKEGYLIRKKNADGTKDWIVSYQSQVGENPSRENTYKGKTLVGKIGTISNKEDISNKDNKEIKNISNPEIIDDNSPIEKQIGEMIYLFKNLNPVYKQWFQRNAIRNKCKSLLEEFGFIKVKNAIQFAEKIISDEFAPVITTPYELENRWGKLQAYYLKKNNKQAGKNYDK